MYCPNCNRKNDQNARFCSGCGLELPEEQVTSEPIVISGGLIQFGKRKTLQTGPWLFKCVAKDSDPNNNVDPLYIKNQDGTITGIGNPNCLALCTGDAFAAKNAYYTRMHRYLKKNINIGDSFLIEGIGDCAVVIMDGMKFEITRSPLNP